MTSFLDNVTLQINLCAGDILYAEQTVPKIIENHAAIKKILLLVDTYKPQKTKIVNPEERFPEPDYSQKVSKIKEIATNFLKQGLVSDVYFFENDEQLIKKLASKYLHKSFTHTHDTTGMAIMPYWAGIEKVTTQYVLHYDADIITYHAKNYDWVSEAIAYMENEKDIVSAIARNAPPAENIKDVPTFHQGRPIEEFQNFWLNDWFGTRCFLLDKNKLENYLPLLKGKLLAEAFGRRILDRNFPLSPEYVMFKQIGQQGGRKLILKNKNAWTLHPIYKKEEFCIYLPQIFKTIENNNIPQEQRGWEDMKWDIWKEFLGKNNS